MDLDGELPDWMPNLTLMEWVVVGVVIVVILIGLCGCCCCCCAWKKKKRRREREKWARRVNYEEKKESDKAELVQKSLKVERERHDLEREKWMDTEVERRIQTELEKKETVPQPKVELAVELEQLNKVEQQVELLVELARHGSSINTGLTGYNSRDQLLMELARRSEADSRADSREQLLRAGSRHMTESSRHMTESYRAESESYQGSRMGSDRWADSGKGSELYIDNDVIDSHREQLIRSPPLSPRIRSPKLTNEGKIRIPMKKMKPVEPAKETDDELKRLVQELRDREREKLIQELREEARAKLVVELAQRDSPTPDDTETHSEKQRHFEQEERARAERDRNFGQPKHNKSDRSHKSERERHFEQPQATSDRHFEQPQYENPGVKSPLLRELETQRKETLHNIDVEKVQLMKTESKLMIAPEPSAKTVQSYAGGWLADNNNAHLPKEPSEPWRVIHTDESPRVRDLHSLQSPSLIRHNSGSDTYSEEESEDEGPQGWKRLRSPEVNRRREGEIKRAQDEEQAKLVQELLNEEREMLQKVESQQSLFAPKEAERRKEPERSQTRHKEPVQRVQTKPARPVQTERTYKNPVQSKRAQTRPEDPLSPPPPLPPRPTRPDKFKAMGSKKSNLELDVDWTEHETMTTRSNYSETERLMGLSQLESDEDNQWSSDEEGRSEGTTRSEVERNEWIQSEQARWIQAEEVERNKYQKSML